MNKWLRIVSLLALLLGASGSVYAQSETFDFTGVASAGNSLAGDIVTGTFTIDYSAADPAESIGLLGSSAFAARNYGGTGYGMYSPDVTDPVFSMTAMVAGISYVTTPGAVGDAGYNSYAEGSINGASGYLFLDENLNVTPSSVGSTSSYIQFYVPYGAAYNAEGFPTFSGMSSVGGFMLANSSEVAWSMTSVTPAAMVTAVPEPSTYAIITVGLMFLGLACLKRKPASVLGLKRILRGA